MRITPFRRPLGGVLLDEPVRPPIPGGAGAGTSAEDPIEIARRFFESFLAALGTPGRAVGTPARPGGQAVEYDKVFAWWYLKRRVSLYFRALNPAEPGSLGEMLRERLINEALIELARLLGLEGIGVASGLSAPPEIVVDPDAERQYIISRARLLLYEMRRVRAEMLEEARKEAPAVLKLATEFVQIRGAAAGARALRFQELSAALERLRARFRLMADYFTLNYNEILSGMSKYANWDLQHEDLLKQLRIEKDKLDDINRKIASIAGSLERAAFFEGSIVDEVSKEEFQGDVQKALDDAERGIEGLKYIDK